MSGFRLSEGGRIDRGRKLSFRFDGRRYEGFAGDTLASALIANGVCLVARSFKFHRPRGLLSAGVEEPNAIVQIRSPHGNEPNARSTLVPLTDGLEVWSQNHWPTLRFDFGRLLDRTRWLWPAGFQNKTFMWPSWRWYEPLVRGTAGMGRLQRSPDATRYLQRDAHCDVLVCGGGRSGLAAALEAGRGGARVILVEQDFEIGGRLLLRSSAELAVFARELGALENVRVLTSATCIGYYDHDVVSVYERVRPAAEQPALERYWRIRAKTVVIATGAFEQPLVFPNNDRPGIMLAGAVRHYLARFAVLPGRRAVVATNNDSAYATAFALHHAGADVVAVVDVRERIPAALAAGTRERGIEVHPQSVIANTRGTKAIRAARVVDLEGRAGRWLSCDLLATSGGWNPAVQLFCQAGGKLAWREDVGCFVPDHCCANVRVVGRANGELDAANGPFRRVPCADSHREWIDFQLDVTAGDVELAAREGFASVEHMKRYTGVGMAVDQGKIGNVNAMTLLGEATGRTVAEVGTTTFRPPFTPLPFGALAGLRRDDLYRPIRLLPVHTAHEASGAVFEEYGGWRRPACYPREGESREVAIRREVLAVRNGVGIFDATPLGKVEVIGPDAAEFLDHLYVNNIRSLRPGHVRYGILLTESGVILDDGVVARLAPERFVLSTSSSGADRVTSWLEEWQQCEWPELDVVLLPVTTQWGVLTLAGPKGRDVLERAGCDVDLSATAFPHLQVREGRLRGLPMRIQRVSFSGEASFEIMVPADYAVWLWEELLRVGEALGITPHGVESLLILRMEKGFLHVGVDTDGTTNALDIGMAGIVERKKGDFVGRRSLARPNDQRSNRRQLVGVEPVGDATLRAGAHLVVGEGDARRSEGWVSAACESPTLGRPIGLAMVEGGFGRIGETLTAFDDGYTFSVRVVDRVFYDPDGERLDG